MSTQPRVAFVQDGARLHYAIPIALHRAGFLERVFCEWYSAPGSFSRFLSTLAKWKNPALGQRMLDRYHPDLHGATVLSNPLLEIRLMRGKKRFPSTADYFHWHAEQRLHWIRRKGFGHANLLMGFNGNIHPALISHARSLGLYTISDQVIAPAIVAAQEDELQRQPPLIGSPNQKMTIMRNGSITKKPPGIASITSPAPPPTSATDFSSRASPKKKISVLPYPIDASHFPFVDRSTHSGPIIVGFVGRVNLRKGAPYFFELARRFDPAKVKFIMVGPVDLPPAIAARFPPHVELLGSVPRSQIPTLLSRFDIYCFPSTCEGSAGSISEAMCTGLPILTSPNSGSVVIHGQEGFICKYDDLDAATLYLQRLTSDRDLRLEMGRRAAEFYRSFDITQYAGKLKQLVTSVLQTQLSPETPSAAAISAPTDRREKSPDPRITS